MKNKFVIWGCGKYYQNNKDRLQVIEIVAFVDSDLYKQGSMVDGIDVLSPFELLNVEYDKILIMIQSRIEQAQVFKKITHMGVSEEKVLCGIREFQSWNSYCDITIRCNKMVYRKEKKKIVILSGAMYYNGAIIVLLHAVTIWIKNGYEIIVITHTDGPLREKFENCGAMIWLTQDISINNVLIRNLVAESVAVFANTYEMSNVIDGWCWKDIPVFWWLHESKSILELFPNYRSITGTDHLHILGVSEIAKQDFEEIQKIKVEDVMPFGIPDTYVANKKKEDKFVFAVIGSVERRKAQEIFVAAAKMILNEYENVEFWVIGGDNNAFANNLKESCRDILQIKWMGQVEHDEVLKLYSSIDVSVCPSREETMSAVTIEAMMNGIPVIVSDKTGIADYIENNVSGLICKAEDILDLKEKMELLILNPELRRELGKNGRRVYERMFTMEAFEERLMQQINKYVK